MTQQLLNAAVLGSIYSLFALGLTLVWGTANILNLAHGALFVFGALVAYVIGGAVDLPLIVMLPVVAICTGLVAGLMDAVAFRPISHRVTNPGKRELAVLLASLGAAAILTNVVDEVTGYQIKRIPAEVLTVRSYSIGSMLITNLQFIIVVLGLGLTILMAIWVQKSAHGRALRAVAFDRSLAPLFGINGDGLSRMTLVVAGAFAGIAGLLLSINVTGFESRSGDALLLKAFVTVIVGGIGSIRGTAVAAYALATMEVFLVAYGPSQARDAVTFGAILVILILRPQGLFGTKSTERA